jgi:hypothetical protein
MTALFIFGLVMALAGWIAFWIVLTTLVNVWYENRRAERMRRSQALRDRFSAWRSAP